MSSNIDRCLRRFDTRDLALSRSQVTREPASDAVSAGMESTGMDALTGCVTWCVLPLTLLLWFQWELVQQLPVLTGVSWAEDNGESSSECLRLWTTAASGRPPTHSADQVSSPLFDQWFSEHHLIWRRFGTLNLFCYRHVQFYFPQW